MGIDPIGAIKGVSDIVKVARETAKKYDNAEIIDSLAEVTERLYDAREQLMADQEERQALKMKVDNLEKALHAQEEIVFDKIEQAYMLKDDPSIEAGRFCQVCFASDMRICLQADLARGIDERHYSPRMWFCPKCNNRSPRTTQDTLYEKIRSENAK